MKILVFGLGVNQGGVGSARFFAQKDDQVRVTDLKNEEQLKVSLDELKDFPNIEYSLGGHKEEDIDWADLIIKNPAVKPGNPYIENAKKLGKDIEMDMGIFLEHVKSSQVIGITGTKGKSTTASLIFEVLSKHLPGEVTDVTSDSHLGGGPTLEGEVLLAGNIGKSVLDVIPQVKQNSMVVLELSSFQLEAWEKHHVSPHIAVITNIYPDHLNYYKTIIEYTSWKKVIAKYQKSEDYLFLRKNDPVTTTSEFLEGIKSQVNYFSADDLPADFKPNLLGEHNRENIAAALAVVKTLGVDETKALETLANFPGVEFRQQLIKEWNGVKIINDTTATGPDPAIQALKTFPGSIVIAGGMNKGMSYDEYTKMLEGNAKEIFFLEGDSTDLIVSLLRAQRSNPSTSSGLSLKIHGPYNDLEKLLYDVKEVVQPGDTILFSPAATSFNLFQNEFDRGRKFNQAVEKIFK